MQLNPGSEDIVIGGDKNKFVEKDRLDYECMGGMNLKSVLDFG